MLIGPRLAAQPPEETIGGDDRTILEQVDALMEAEGIDRKTALKRVAKQRAIARIERAVQRRQHLERRRGIELGDQAALAARHHHRRADRLPAREPRVPPRAYGR